MKNNWTVINSCKFNKMFSRRKILKKVDELAARIKADYDDKDEAPLLLFVLTGGLYLGVDLSRALDKIGFRHSVDTVGIQSYPGRDEQPIPPRLISEPHAELGGRDIIVAEDLIDHGFSMNFLDRYLLHLETPPRSISYCALLMKETHDPLDFEVKYLGWIIGPEWVVGNGMDSAQHYRGIVDIYAKENIM